MTKAIVSRPNAVAKRKKETVAQSTFEIRAMPILHRRRCMSRCAVLDICVRTTLNQEVIDEYSVMKHHHELFRVRRIELIVECV